MTVAIERWLTYVIRAILANSYALLAVYEV